MRQTFYLYAKLIKYPSIIPFSDEKAVNSLNEKKNLPNLLYCRARFQTQAVVLPNLNVNLLRHSGSIM